MTFFELQQGLTVPVEVLSGDPSLSLCGLTGLGFLKPGHLTFVKDSKKLKELRGKIQAGLKLNQVAILMKADLVVESIMDDFKEAQLVAKVSDIETFISAASRLFHERYIETTNDKVDGRQMGTTKIHPTAWISQGVFLGKNVQVGENVVIHPGCVVMSDSVIDEGSVLFPNVTLYPKTEVGKFCAIHSGSVLGADGFGYHFSQGKHQKIYHLGKVVIEDHVEIGANSTVDRATFDETRIGAGTKIDNQVHVAHNGQVGKNVLLCGQAGLAGSVTIGDYSVLGGRVAVTSDVKIGSKCQIAGNSGVSGDVPDGSIYAGHPARPLTEWLRGVAYLRKLSLKEKKS